MSKHRQLVYGQPIPQDFLDALQEFVGMQHSGLQLSVVQPGTVGQPANQVQVTAASGNGQVAISINGLWRYVSSPPAPISISGAPGTYDIFACTGNNNFAVNASPPPPELDTTDYTFSLQAFLQGNTPTSLPNYRKIGECVFDGTRILYLRQTLGGGDSYRQFQPGDLKLSACASPPPGWLLCDGSTVSRATYGVLYAALGGSASPFGQGDGTNTFTLPDYRGRTPIGVGTPAGAAGGTSHGLGTSGGEETHVLTNAQMPQHSHGGSAGYTSVDHYHTGTSDTDYPDHAHQQGGPNQNNVPVTQSGGAGCAVMGGTPPYTYGASARHTHTFTTSWMSAITGAYNHTHSIGADGGSAAHNNLHPFTTCNVFIKY